MQIVLRLLCLASLTAGGVKAKNLESLKREILQVCPSVYSVIWFLHPYPFYQSLNCISHPGVWLRLPTTVALALRSDAGYTPP